MMRYVKDNPTRLLLKTRVAFTSPFFLVFYLLLPSVARAETPTEQVRATVEQVLTIIRNPKLKSESQHEEFRAQLAQAIYLRFDFAEMAKRSLGPHWAPRSLQEQQEFVKIFTELLKNSYLDKIESYSSHNIRYTREVEDGNYAVVDTKMIPNNRKELSINYKLHSVGNDWRVYDLAIENISVVNNYRSQFNRVVIRSSFEHLVRMIKERQTQGSEKAH